MKKVIKLWLVGLLVGLLAGPSNLFAAASGNYTDLLPIGAAGNTTVISNGSGWSLSTLPPTSTFGDSLSRLVDTIYQSTSAATIATSSAVSTFTALSGQGSVGYITVPAAWIATGRSIRITAKGKYSSLSTNWTWDLVLGTTTVLSTGAQAAVGSQTDQYFSATGLMTIAATGNAGSVNASYDVFVASGAAPKLTVSYSTTTASAVTVDLTSQLTIRPRFTWGTSAGGNSITFTNVLVELLN